MKKRYNFYEKMFITKVVDLFEINNFVSDSIRNANPNESELSFQSESIRINPLSD